MVGCDEQSLASMGIKDATKASGKNGNKTQQIGTVGPLVFALNGARVEIPAGSVDLRMTLVQYLRAKGHRGTKLACGEGGCGACAVVLSGPGSGHRPMSVNSCLRPLGSMHGWGVITIEGLASSSSCTGGDGSKVHPIQERLAAYHGSQCGFCTPGMINSLYSQLQNAQGGRDTDTQTLGQALDGNICRCTGYRPILDAAASFTPSDDKKVPLPSSDIEDLGRFPRDGPVGPYDVTTNGQGNGHNGNGNGNGNGHINGCDNGAPAWLADVLGEGLSALESSDGTLWYMPTTLTQLNAVRVAYPCARLLGGNTSSGLYKDATLDDLVEDEEEAPSSDNKDGPKVVVCLERVKEVHGFTIHGHMLTVGAAETLSSFISGLNNLTEQGHGSPVLEPLLVHLRRIAGTLVRNAATLGGNIVLARLKDLESDLCTLLVGLGCVLTLCPRDPSAAKDMPLLEYLHAEDLPSGSLLLSLTFPLALTDPKAPNAPIEVFRSYRTSIRHGNSHALANAAFRCLLDPSTSTITSITLAFGALGSPAIRASKTEAALLNKAVDQTTLEAALLELRKEVVPKTKSRYRYRLELLSSYVYKFLLSLKAPTPTPTSASASSDGGGEDTATLDARLASAALPPTQRPMPQGRALYSKANGNADGSKATHQPHPKDSRHAQVSGQAAYVGDLKDVEGTLHGAYVKSPRAVGTLAELTMDKALACPGVFRILTATDIPGLNDAAFSFGAPDKNPDHIFVPLGGRVFFHSQPLALVLADSADNARAAAKLVEVKFEGFEAPLVTIGDAREAKSFMGIRDSVKRGDAPTIISQARALAESQGGGSTTRVVKGSVKGGSQMHMYLETQSAYAVPDEDRLVVWSSTQAPECVQKVVAKALNVPMHDIQVKHRRAGGAFGAKATRNIPHAAAAAVAAKVTGRGVRVTLDWETDMQLTGGRHEVEAEYEVAFDACTGVVSGVVAEIFLNGGFCADLSFTPCHDMAVNLEQAYFIPNLHASIEVMRTNLPTRTAMRAPGVVQASLVMESIMDSVAREANLDPETVRQANFFSPDNGQSSGCAHMPASQISHFTLPKIWTQLSASSNLSSRRAAALCFNLENRWRKRGLAMTPVKFHSALMPMQATLNVYKDGSVLLHHGGCEIGQGIHSKSAQVAVDELSVLVDDGPLPLSLIRLADTDTDVIPNGGFTAASTTSERACAAVQLACQEAVKRLTPIRDALKKDKPESPVTWATLIATATSFRYGVDLCCHVQYRPSVGHYHNYGAAMAEVEIDLLTGEVEVLAAHVLYDCGRSLNPAIDLGQVEGAFVQGLGYYLTEEALIASDGQLQSKGTWTYKPLMAYDLPRDWRCELLENVDFDKGFLSSKASGEPPLVLSTSVFMAIRDAITSARQELNLPPTFSLPAPATVERIHRACGTSFAHMRLDSGAPQSAVWYDESPVMSVGVAVAGAGLGGLAMGIQLHNKGIDGHLFERAPALRDVSQGLVGITPNGMRALELIDPRLKTYLFEKGKYNTEAFTKTIDIEGSSERTVTFEANNLSIPWADIQHSLARLVPKHMIHCNYDYAGNEEDEEGVTVYFRGRMDTVRCKVLVGIDGLFSGVRKSVAPFPDNGGDEVGESGHTNWNAIMNPSDTGLPYPHPVVSLTYNKSDPPRFFFLIECGHGRILWQVRVDDPEKQYTVAPKKGHGRLGLKGVKQRILDMIQDVPDVLPYISATPEETIFERCLLFRKMLCRYSSPGRRVVLCGDAAHAMHSVRGQGANMTFEDAHCLGLALEARGVGPQAVRLYERVRIPRANMVQWESNTYYKKQFEKNTSMEWKFKFLNFQKYVMEAPEGLPPHELADS